MTNETPEQVEREEACKRFRRMRLEIKDRVYSKSRSAFEKVEEKEKKIKAEAERKIKESNSEWEHYNNLHNYVGRRRRKFEDLFSSSDFKIRQHCNPPQYQLEKKRLHTGGEFLRSINGANPQEDPVVNVLTILEKAVWHTPPSLRKVSQKKLWRIHWKVRDYMYEISNRTMNQETYEGILGRKDKTLGKYIGKIMNSEDFLNGEGSRE